MKKPLMIFIIMIAIYIGLFVMCFTTDNVVILSVTSIVLFIAIIKFKQRELRLIEN